MNDICRAYFALEDEAASHGLTMDDLEDRAAELARPRRRSPYGPIAAGRWVTPAPGLLDPLYRVTVYERPDGRFVVSCRCPPQSDGTTRRTVLL